MRAVYSPLRNVISLLPSGDFRHFLDTTALGSIAAELTLNAAHLTQKEQILSYFTVIMKRAKSGVAVPVGVTVPVHLPSKT